MKSPTQHQIVLNALSDGKWHRSDEFIFVHHLTQVAARIVELRAKGYNIEREIFPNEHNYKSYRLTKHASVAQTSIAVRPLTGENTPAPSQTPLSLFAI